MTIADGDEPRVSITADSDTVAESTPQITFTLTRDGLLDARLRASVRISESGRVLASSRSAVAVFNPNSDHSHSHGKPDRRHRG